MSSMDWKAIFSCRAIEDISLQPLACWDCGFKSRWGHRCLSLVIVMCLQVEFCPWGWSLVQRSPTKCGASERNYKSSIMKRPWPTGGLLRHRKKNSCGRGHTNVPDCTEALSRSRKFFFFSPATSSLVCLFTHVLIHPNRFTQYEVQ